MNLRIARHTDDLETLKSFYMTILGLKVIGDFKDHNGYDGVFLGLENENWHLEFTQSQEKAQHTFDEDDLLVFYPKTRESFDEILKNIKAKAVEQYLPKNPYWKENGILIKDPDGFGVIICNSEVGR